MFPRSGGEKVYLEAAYRKPKLLITVVFAVQAIALGFTGWFFAYSDAFCANIAFANSLWVYCLRFKYHRGSRENRDRLGETRYCNRCDCINHSSAYISSKLGCSRHEHHGSV